MTLKVAISGVGGRMGQALVRNAAASGDLRIVGGTERPGSEPIGIDIGILAGLPPAGVLCSADAAAAAADADVWIDFTQPDATQAALEALRGNAALRAAIIGTTGLGPSQDNAIAASAGRLAIVRSGNFSLGVNLLTALVETAAARLGDDWDIEIAETHHRRKADAPSGTALMAAEAAAKGRGRRLSDVRLPPHDGVGLARPQGGIGFSVRRGGGVYGEHHVAFLSEEEVLTISHTALNRDVFAAGALHAARWAARAPSGVYDMRDVLGF
jgi:4-hydroxy-tetrahydrodipicolinate reductase